MRFQIYLWSLKYFSLFLTVDIRFYEYTSIIFIYNVFCLHILFILCMKLSVLIEIIIYNKGYGNIDNWPNTTPTLPPVA
jgi:hypothetical protein